MFLVNFRSFLMKQAPRGAAPQGTAPLKGRLGRHVKAKAYFTCASPSAGRKLGQKSTGSTYRKVPIMWKKRTRRWLCCSKVLNDEIFR